MANKMTEPSVDELVKKVDSQYTLVIMVARRARAINDEENTSDRYKVKSVTTALEEIDKNMVTYMRRGEEIKK